MITANLYEIAALVAALALLLLIIFAIPALIQIKKTARSVEALTGESKKTLDTLNALLKKTGESAGELDVLVKKLKDLNSRLSSASEVMSGGLRNVLITLLSVIIGFQYGLKCFINSNEKKEEKGEEDGKGQE